MEIDREPEALHFSKLITARRAGGQCQLELKIEIDFFNKYD